VFIKACKPVEIHEISVLEHRNAKGPETSKVFGLTAFYLSSPLPALLTKAYLKKTWTSLRFLSEYRLEKDY